MEEKRLGEQGLTVAAMGLKLGRMARSLRVLRRPLYWLWFGVLMLFGAYLPYRLIWWVSYKGDLRAEAVSMGLRFFASYLVVTIAWIALGRPKWLKLWPPGPLKTIS